MKKIRFRDLENLVRYRRVVKNPWQAATARSRGEPGQRVPLHLRRGGQLWIRSQTSDIRVFSVVFVKDVYRVASLEARCRSRGPFDCVVDVGGHIGVFSARVAGFTNRDLNAAINLERFATASSVGSYACVDPSDGGNGVCRSTSHGSLKREANTRCFARETLG